MTQPLPPLATVYGTRLATHSEWAHWAPRMTASPHQRAPTAPVAYIKPCNTFSADGASVTLPPGATELEVGATLALALQVNQALSGDLTAQAAIKYIAICNDWQVPHDGLYRPPVRFNSFDGALGVSALSVPWGDVADWTQWRVDILVNQVQVGQWTAADLIEPPPQMLRRMGEFTQWAAGDMLLLGSAWPRPRVRAGDVVALVAHLGPHTLQLTQTVQAGV